MTEGLWQRLYRPSEGGVSIHGMRFPEPRGVAEAPEMAFVTEVLRRVRAARTEQRLPQSLDSRIRPGHTRGAASSESRASHSGTGNPFCRRNSGFHSWLW